ncbi:MAG: NAD(P)-binding protein [Actinomycetota bacterium]|nr:NAD(P)-binding protein [Actinomycetota bacterium]
MSEVTVVGAGLAGLTAAINCARSGHEVKVLERFDRLGGIPYIRPAVDVTPMESERLGKFIGVELKPPYVVPTDELVAYIYGRRFSFRGTTMYLHSVERGSRSTSLDSYLYELALQEGVEFEFGSDLTSQQDFASLPPNTIVATGLFVEPFLALRRPYLDIFGYIAKTRTEGPPRVLAFFDTYTKYYCYCANQNGVAFVLAFDAGPVSESMRNRLSRQLEDYEGLSFEEWIPHQGVVATRAFGAPGLISGQKVLAGTLAGMQDPFALFGVHGSLVSGKIAAMAIDDWERAWRLFSDFSSSYRYSWLAKRLFDLQPHWMRRIGLPLGVGLWSAFPDLLQPLMDRVYRVIPGFGKLRGM